MSALKPFGAGFGGIVLKLIWIGWCQVSLQSVRFWNFSRRFASEKQPTQPPSLWSPDDSMEPGGFPSASCQEARKRATIHLSGGIALMFHLCRL